MWIAALALCLQACATPSPRPPPTQISPSLTVPCPPHLARALETYGDVALDYSEVLAELKDCRARHRALAEAVTNPPLNSGK